MIFVTLPRSGAAALVLSVLTACAGPRPSTVPLGTGPLDPGYRLAARPHERTTDHRAAETTPREASSTPSSGDEDDGGDEDQPETPASPVAGETPGGSADRAGKTGALLDPASFLGEYSGDDVSTYRLEGMPDREDRDPNAKIVVKAGDGQTIDIVLVDSSNGKDICTLEGVVGDRNATIAAGQKCFEQTGTDASATATIRTGTATVDGRRLVVDLALAFEMHLEDEDTSGTLDYHFDGKRR